MNSNYGNKSFDFDLGINKSSSRSLNDQKNQTSKPNTTWTSHQPNKNNSRASWTHQPVGSLSGPTSMVGDILGKSWGSTNQNSGIGVVKKDPNLFGDLLNSALGQNKGNSNSNVPLKNAAPLSDKSSFSMGGFADSLPKTGNSSKSGGNWGSSESFSSYTSGFSGNGSGGGNTNSSGYGNKGGNIGGPSLKSMAGIGGSGGMGTKKDPFGSLVDFSSKSSGTVNSGIKGSTKSSVGDDAFGSFQNASKTSTTTFSSSSFTSVNNDSKGPGVGGSNTNVGGSTNTNVDDFGFFNSQPQNQPSVKSSGVGDFDALFSSTTGPSGGATTGNVGIENQQFSGSDDWGLDSEFGGGNDKGGTTELEGLPPPPAGVSAASAKNKGLDNYKQGQYADAIKWLSWAVVLLEKSGDDAGTMEVLTCRASCYKEVGEYKKAVADCTKALEQDSKNVTILVQRALLYESMEKYKLGAEDLRTVMKIDPGNRVARSTIHRLTKMAE